MPELWRVSGKLMYMNGLGSIFFSQTVIRKWACSEVNNERQILSSYVSFNSFQLSLFSYKQIAPKGHIFIQIKIICYCKLIVKSRNFHFHGWFILFLYVWVYGLMVYKIVALIMDSQVVGYAMLLIVALLLRLFFQTILMALIVAVIH